MNQDLTDFVSIQIPGTEGPDGLPPSSEVIRYNEFVRLLFKADTEPMMAIHAALGLAGEILELAEIVNIDHYLLRKRDADHDREELGDIEFYLQAIRNHYGLSRAADVEYAVGNSFLDLSVQVGGLVDLIKKEYIYNKPRDLAMLSIGLSNIEQRLARMYKMFQRTRQEVLQANADKLSKRYLGLKYSDTAAITRADKPQGE